MAVAAHATGSAFDEIQGIARSCSKDLSTVDEEASERSSVSDLLDLKSTSASSAAGSWKIKKVPKTKGPITPLPSFAAYTSCVSEEDSIAYTAAFAEVDKRRTAAAPAAPALLSLAPSGSFFDDSCSLKDAPLFPPSVGPLPDLLARHLSGAALSGSEKGDLLEGLLAVIRDLGMELPPAVEMSDEELFGACKPTGREGREAGGGPREDSRGRREGGREGGREGAAGCRGGCAGVAPGCSGVLRLKLSEGGVGYTEHFERKRQSRAAGAGAAHKGTVFPLAAASSDDESEAFVGESCHLDASGSLPRSGSSQFGAPEGRGHAAGHGEEPLSPVSLRKGLQGAQGTAQHRFSQLAPSQSGSLPDDESGSLPLTGGSSFSFGVGQGAEGEGPLSRAGSHKTGGTRKEYDREEGEEEEEYEGHSSYKDADDDEEEEDEEEVPEGCLTPRSRPNAGQLRKQKSRTGRARLLLISLFKRR